MELPWSEAGHLNSSCYVCALWASWVIWLALVWSRMQDISNLPFILAVFLLPFALFSKATIHRHGLSHTMVGNLTAKTALKDGKPEWKPKVPLSTCILSLLPVKSITYSPLSLGWRKTSMAGIVTLGQSHSLSLTLLARLFQKLSSFVMWNESFLFLWLQSKQSCFTSPYLSSSLVVVGKDLTEEFV